MPVFQSTSSTSGPPDIAGLGEANNLGIQRARARMIALGSKPGELTPAEKAEYDRLQALVAGVPQSSAGSNTKDIFDGQRSLLDATNAFTEKQMALSNMYRTKEGATQAQIDEQMNRRILTDGDVKIRMQGNSARLTEEAKQADARRALLNFRSNGRGS